MHRLDDNDYQGDTRALIKGKDGRYGYLKFGWGSCSGCDALQACRSYENLGELISELQQAVRWGTATDILTFLRTHDWAGDYDYRR